jgi:hypothetical protein
MRDLAAISRQGDLRELFAEVLASNAAMLKVFENSGLKVSTERDGTVVHVTLSLAYRVQTHLRRAPAQIGRQGTSASGGFRTYTNCLGKDRNPRHSRPTLQARDRRTHSCRAAINRATLRDCCAR